MESGIFMKNIRKWLIIFLTFLTLFAVGCSNGKEQATTGSNDSKGNYKQLKGKLISQGVFEVTENTKGKVPAGTLGNLTRSAEEKYGKGKYVEFLDDKELILGQQKMKYEWIDSDKIAINYAADTKVVHKYSYNNGVFRLYLDKEYFYIDFVKEGMAYTAEKPSTEDLNHPSIEVARDFFRNVSMENGDYSQLSTQLKEKLIKQSSTEGKDEQKNTQTSNLSDKNKIKGQVNDDQKIRQTLKPLADSIKGLGIHLPLEGDYKIKEKSDSRTVIEVYAKDKLFKTLTLELNKNNEKWEIVEII